MAKLQIYVSGYLRAWRAPWLRAQGTYGRLPMKGDDLLVRSRASLASPEALRAARYRQWLAERPKPRAGAAGVAPGAAPAVPEAAD